MTHWFEGNIEKIADMLRAGMRASQIARKFHVGKGAVCGIVRRNALLREIGFQHRPAPINIEKATSPRLWRRKPAKAKNPPLTEPVVSFGAPQVAGMPLMMLGLRHCRWCINDPEPGSNGHLFCGETTNSPAKPYCAFHAAEAVGAGTFAEKTATSALRRAA